METKFIKNNRDNYTIVPHGEYEFGSIVFDGENWVIFPNLRGVSWLHDIKDNKSLSGIMSDVHHALTTNPIGEGQ